MREIYRKRVETLLEALPYIRMFSGTTMVIKYGGAAMSSADLKDEFATDIALLRYVGIRPIIVHGGGNEISGYMKRLDLPVRFVEGLRVTDKAAMEVTKMVLVGKVNKELVSAINGHGRLAVGISGDDANLIKARPISARLGRVGEVEAIDTTVVTNLIEDGFIPVIATVGYGDDGGSYNINADLVAGDMAAALGAAKVIFLTDVDGLYADFDDKGSLISALSLAEAEGLIAEDRLSSGMIPKVGACARALRGGVPRAHILNGKVPHAVLLEVFTDEGVGTMITADGNHPAAVESALGAGRG